MAVSRWKEIANDIIFGAEESSIEVDLRCMFGDPSSNNGEVLDQPITPLIRPAHSTGWLGSQNTRKAE